MANPWKVTGGISVWKDKIGKLIEIDGDEIVIRIKDIELDKEYFYDVRMPLICCTEVLYEKAKKR